MKTITRLLTTAALLFGVLGGVCSVKAAKAIGTKYTSVAQLSGKAFAIVNETDGKAICNVTSYNGSGVGYLPYANAFSSEVNAYLFIIEQVNDPQDEAANGKYLIRAKKEDGSDYKVWNGFTDPYLQTHVDNDDDCCLFFGFNVGKTRGADVNNAGVWDIQYDADKGGWSLKNVATGKYFKDGTQAATSETPVYYTFCEVKDAVVPFDQNVEINGRNYQLYVPSTVTTNCPLVISLHGANGSSTGKTPFKTTVADEVGCIVVYPQGLPTAFPIGFGGTTTGWTASGEHNFDVEFLEAVIEDVASKYIIDRKRIYCCGFSNGGMMTYAMANACSDKIAAFAAISGYPLNEFHLRHTGDRPVPFMHIHGKKDGFVPYAKVPTIVDEMVARLGANPVPTKTYENGYTKSVYAAADGSFPYVYYEIDEMGHSPYTGNTEEENSGKTMWNFFKEYTLDSPCDKTLKWAPRIDENGYTPAEHGWTKNDGTTLLQFGGDQYTTTNQNVYHSLQFNSGSYKLSFKSTGEEGKTIGVKIEKLTSPNTVVLNKTVNVGEDAELPFDVADGWGEYQLTMTRPSADDAITISDLAVTQTDAATPVANNHYRLYAKSFSTSGTNITYADGKLKWTETSNNVAGAITADPGVIAKFSSIHFTCSGLTEGATYRVMLTTSDKTSYISEINATGDVTVNFSDLTKQWGSEKLTPEILETVTQVRIGGGTGGSPTAESPYEMTLDVSSFYIESEEDYLPIANSADWDIFSKMVKAGVAPLNAQLTADVDAGRTMVGTDADGKRYIGTFDGAGHTLTFNYEGGGQFVAPFSCIDGATIKDLLTAGRILTSNNMPGGFVGKNVGNSTLTRCGSSMTLTTTDSGNGRIGGLVGRCADGNQMTFNNCVFNGAISTATSGYACGFVGWDNQANKITLNNCLVAASSITGGGQNFINNTPIIPSGKYALYISQFGSSTQGTAVTDAQRYSGQAAYTLNQGIGSGALFFGQGKLNSSIVEETPSLTSDASKKVVRTYKGETNFYSNPGGLLPDPALASMLSWKFAMSGEAPYQTHLPAEQTTDREIYGSPDAYILAIGNAGVSTFVFPFTTDGLPSGVKAYDLTFDGTVINATEVNKITADKPVFIKAEAGTYKFESKLNWWDSVNYSAHTETTNGALTGVYCTDGIPFKTVPDDAYILQARPDGVGFYKVAEGSAIKITSFRAYLTASSSARSLPIVFSDDEPTGVDAALMNNEEMNNEVYNLCGQRVEKATKGLYIKNGKKVIMK